MFQALNPASLLIALILCLGAACAPPPDDPIAIKKAAAKPETPTVAQADYAMRTFVGDYLRAGHRSAAWDGNVTNGLSAYVRARASLHADEREIARTSLTEALRLGCDDPMVIYLLTHLKYGDGSHADAAQAAEWVGAAEGLVKSEYSHLRKAWGAFRAAEALDASKAGTNLTEEIVQWRNETYNQCVAMLADEPATPPEDVCLLITAYLSRTGRKAYTDSFDALWPPLYARYPKSAGIWQIRGRYYIDYASQARGGAYADKVSADAWKLFRQRLALAQKALEKSWNLRPMEQTAIQCLRLELGQGQGKKRMEMFFQRAMLLNTNSYNACKEKLVYLYPRWYGSPEEMLQFGWECVNSKTWGGNVPLIMLDVQDELARLAYPGKENDQERKAYWTRPEVWPAIQSAFLKYFELNPSNTGWRHNEFWYACQCQRWDLANELLGQLGRINYSYFGGREAFERMAAETRSHAVPPKI
jgi:hypothetical protein